MQMEAVDSPHQDGDDPGRRNTVSEQPNARRNDAFDAEGDPEILALMEQGEPTTTGRTYR